MNTVEAQLREKLVAQFDPIYLQVVNESHQHSVPPGSETHFKVTLVSSLFDGKRQVQRHQAVYGCLANELRSGVHALALHTFSPSEWERDCAVPDSPQCLGGGKKA